MDTHETELLMTDKKFRKRVQQMPNMSQNPHENQHQISAKKNWGIDKWQNFKTPEILF